MAKPFVKWVGGKTQLLPSLSKLIPATHTRYYEPFVGGGACFLSLAEQRCFRSAVLNDVNPELVNLYQVVKKRPGELMDALDSLCMDNNWNTREYHARMRSVVPLGELERAVRFIYLNKTSFNGLWRVNKAGKFNVPFGKYARPKLYDRQNLLAASRILQSVVIRNLDFHVAVNDASAGDVIYFDPPYVKLSRTSSFTAYAGKFGMDEQIRLAKLCHKLVQQGVYCVVSNSDTPLVRELYAGFELVTVQARRSVNSDPTKRGKISELLAVGEPAGWLQGLPDVGECQGFL